MRGHFGVPKHSELEPDYLLAERDGNASASGSLKTIGQVFTTISHRIIIPGWIGTTGLVENDGRIFVRAEFNQKLTPGGRLCE
jgi:hypothetical protein